MDYILLFTAVYLIFLAVSMDTSDTKSTIVFKLTPAILAVLLSFNALSSLGWLS